MGDTVYELLALGLRYVFVLLATLMLLRVVLTMWADKRSYQQALRQLPDAGLVGEVVDLSNGRGQPLPREGLIGSGRSCDIRIGKLHRREMEFAFRPGLGLKLIPLRRRHQALLDEVPLNRADAYALHGTILDIRGTRLRFRLFAGLDLPQRQLVHQLPTEEGLYDLADDALSQLMDPGAGLPPAIPPDPMLEMTWQHAPLPPELLSPPDSATPKRRRRARREEEV